MDDGRGRKEGKGEREITEDQSKMDLGDEFGERGQ
jgi:hypothetical protein